ncbi:hypothetical protein G9444_3288 [Rhodococcus erythropolis]|uniref:Uncharacterized protein n=1 Tax=Rhodococcus erythropolis TaxID=1833 RepID=A0A6G9CUJ9_RHOER|nr:hypothetical protein G9444_3288 [Rhodococcus erythropolis]
MDLMEHDLSVEQWSALKAALGWLRVLRRAGRVAAA